MGLLDNFPVILPRIGVTLGGVTTSNIDEPTTKKNDGYGVDDPLPSGEFNWILSRTYIWLGYLQTALAGLFDQNFVMRDSTTAGSVVMTGAGSPTYTFDVDVPERKVWIEGASYEVPATTLLADPVAPGDQRIDLVVATADSVAGTAEWEIVEGTADPSPTEPAIASNQVAIARYTMIQQAEIEDDVNLEDITERGAFQNARMIASKVFRAGFRASSSNWNLEVDQANDAVNMKGDIDLGNSGALTGVKDVALTLNNGSTLAGAVNVTGQLTVNPSFGIEWSSPPVKIKRLLPMHFVNMYDGSRTFTQGGNVYIDEDGVAVFRSVTDKARGWLHIDVPDGVTVTQVRVTGEQVGGTAGTVLGRLREYAGSAGPTVRDFAVGNATSSDGDSFTITIDVDPDEVADSESSSLILEMHESTNNNMSYLVDNVEVTYSVDKVWPQ